MWTLFYEEKREFNRIKIIEEEFIKVEIIEKFNGNLLYIEKKILLAFDVVFNMVAVRKRKS